MCSCTIYTATAAPWTDFSCTCHIYIMERQESSVSRIIELCARKLWKWSLIQGSDKRLHHNWHLDPPSGQLMLFSQTRRCKLSRHDADHSPITYAMVNSTPTPQPPPSIFILCPPWLPFIIFSISKKVYQCQQYEVRSSQLDKSPVVLLLSLIFISPSSHGYYW
jgi:hypothetical protein